MSSKLKRNAEGILYMPDKNGVKPLLANGDKELFGTNEDQLGQRQLWNRVQAKLDSQMSSEHSLILLKELYTTYCVYEISGKLYKRSYSLDQNGQVTLGNDVTEVQEETQYQPTNQMSDHVEPMSALGFNFGRD